MKAVFGYDASTALSEIQNSYEKKLLEQSRGLGPDAYNQMLTETQSMIHANQKYPWLILKLSRACMINTKIILRS